MWSVDGIRLSRRHFLHLLCPCHSSPMRPYMTSGVSAQFCLFRDVVPPREWGGIIPHPSKPALSPSKGGRRGAVSPTPSKQSLLRCNVALESFLKNQVNSPASALAIPPLTEECVSKRTVALLSTPQPKGCGFKSRLVGIHGAVQFVHLQTTSSCPIQKTLRAHYHCRAQ